MRWLVISLVSACLGLGFGAAISCNYRPNAPPETFVSPSLSLCIAGPDGGCSDGVTPPVDAGFSEGVTWLAPPASGSASGTLHDGDEVLLVDALTGSGPQGFGVTWSGTLSTEGVLWLETNGDGGGGLARSTTIQFRPGSGPAMVPARVVGTGMGAAFSSVSAGPTASLYVQSASALVWPRRIAYIEHVGLAARDRVILCSSRSSGTLSVTPSSTTEAVTPTTAALTVVPGGPCPPPYLGEADFVWTGFDPTTVWTVLDGVSGTSTVVVVPTLGTGATLTVGLVRTGTSMTIDAGTSESVTLTLSRSSVEGGLEPLSFTSVSLQIAGMSTIATLRTDAQGTLSFELVATPGATSADVTLVVDGVDTIVVPVPI